MSSDTVQCLASMAQRPLIHFNPPHHIQIPLHPRPLVQVSMEIHEVALQNRHQQKDRSAWEAHLA